MSSLLTTLVCLAMLGASFANAAGPGPSISEAAPSPTGPTRLLGTSCALGNTNSGDMCTCIELLSGDDSWLTPLRLADCPGCRATRLTTAHVWLRFELVAYDVPVSIRIVAATGEPGARVPDLTTELCPPRDYVLSPLGLGPYDFALPLPDGCCIASDAFLRVVFPQGIQGTQVAASWVDGCETFFTDGGALFNLCNWSCPAGGPFCGAAAPVMNVEVECCAPTPVRPRTWGDVKLIYR